jgi:hypothetical protein
MYEASSPSQNLDFGVFGTVNFQVLFNGHNEGGLVQTFMVSQRKISSHFSELARQRSGKSRLLLVTTLERRSTPSASAALPWLSRNFPTRHRH